MEVKKEPLTINTIEELYANWPEVQKMDRDIQAPKEVLEEMKKLFRKDLDKFYSKDHNANWQLAGKDENGLTHHHFFRIHSGRKNKVVPEMAARLNTDFSKWQYAEAVHLKMRNTIYIKKKEDGNTEVPGKEG